MMFSYIVITIVLGARLCTTKKCQAPSPNELEKHWREKTVLHESFFQYSVFREAISPTLDDLYLEYPNYTDLIRKTPLVDRKEVPKCPSLDDAGSLHNSDGDFCPSIPVLNYDESRVPSALLDRVCVCRNCAIGDHTAGRGTEMNIPSPVTTLECIPVKYYTRVLRRVGNDTADCSESYRAVFEPLTILCRCGQRKMVTSAQPEQVHSP
ncbi:hypothetical protein BaRGS_00000238 [Batillaria attramentaria]|uniref:Interleukin 17-like protein n=1 Tax=Batillaria attramentaria TaxID=370345 RepID=A0ABD0MBR7_9CAEN